MKRDWENHINMYFDVKAKLDANSAIWTPKAGFAANVGTFNTKLTVINARHLIVLADTKGQTAAKKQIRRSMAELCDKVGDVVRTVASKANDPELFAVAKTNVSELMTMADTDAEIRARQVHTAADNNSAALVDEGLEASDIFLLLSRIDLYREAINLPRMKEGDIKGANQDLEKLMPDMNKFLRNILDGNIRALADTEVNIAFRAAYTTARRIVDDNGGPTPGEPVPPEPPPPGP